MRSLPLTLMHFVLNTCFHIKIHAAFSLLDFLSELNDLEHDFISLLINGETLSLIDYSQDGHVERLLVRISESNDYWILTLNENGWGIKQASS